MLAERCATAHADRTTRDPGEPGIRLRFFADLRQEPDAWQVMVRPGRGRAARS
ncbi:DUF6207 family protein [Streptomyces sp. NBC_00687]|uniref:DUF6207 family protein n=1 Tax=Streptomyces sp. NBC_00687 TaxID=2975807 RepID=UPI00224D9441|nr:DUF6207 family protein [Streptomyces sp. NBC_00687]MCX4918994.1 DUF6207 family protein [Streptomyces sp. NBC_00687]